MPVILRCHVGRLCPASCAFLLCYGGTGHHAPDSRSQNGALAGRRIVGTACILFRGYGAQQLRAKIPQRISSEFTIFL